MCYLAILFVTFGLGFVSAVRYRGADFSSVLLLESTNDMRYFELSDASSSCPFEHILYEHGVNLARIRVWTTGTYNLTYGLELARRAKAVGMELLIDIHYGDTWADCGHQAIPHDWPTDLSGLLSRVYNYTHGVVEAFKAQGTPIQFIQIGNEINHGVFWPVGQISAHGFAAASELLHAGVMAVRNSSPDTRTIIHLADGWDNASVSQFFDGIFSHTTNKTGLGGGLTASDVDVMGFSFYPYYNTEATLGNLEATMEYLTSTYDKDVMVLETNWPVTCDTVATQLSEPTIPVGVAGQIAWIEGIVGVLDDSCGEKGIGFLYWEPGWLGNAALGSVCADNLLVDSSGVARESMTLFSRFLVDFRRAT